MRSESVTSSGSAGEHAAEHGVAEEAAEAVFVGPARQRHVGRGEGGGGEQRDRGEDRAAEDAAFAGVQDEAQAPDREGERDAVGGPAERAVQRVGERGADEAEGVARRLVGGAEEAGIVGGVGPDHRRGERRDADEDDADELAAPPAQRLLGVALHQRRALGFLAGRCHLSDLLSDRLGGSRCPSVARIASRPRPTLAASATSATRM